MNLPNNIKFRKAILEDAKELSYFKREVWETTYRGIYPDKKLDNYSYEENFLLFQDIIKNLDVELYVLIKDEKIIGYIKYGKPLKEFQNFTHEIGNFYIRKDLQRLGIGRELFNFAYENMKKQGATKFFISCNKYNFNAQKFYEKMGGKIVHTDDDGANDGCPQVKFEYIIK